MVKKEHNFTGKKSFKSMPKQGTQFKFSVAHLKCIVESFLMTNLKNENKRPLLLAVKESVPSSEVSDGFSIISAKFSETSLSAAPLKRIVKDTQIELSDLQNKIILVTKWHMELQNVYEV